MTVLLECLNHYQVGEICLLEQVQRRETWWLVFQLKNVPYSPRLRIVNLPSLPHRKCRMDMIMMYKITQGLSGFPFDKILFYQQLLVNKKQLFYKYYSHLNNRKYYFSQRVINNRNDSHMMFSNLRKNVMNIGISSVLSWYIWGIFLKHYWILPES